MIRIPSGATILQPQAFTRDVMMKTLKDLCAPERDFTGFISIGSADTLSLLFLFQSRPYAAGKTINDKPSPLAIREFFQGLDEQAGTAATISAHACDPVLLKSLLIFMQGDPTVKAPANLINLEAILDQIRRDKADCLIILEKRQMLNLFYFREGCRGMSYFSDTEFHDGAGLPFDEQMLVYAFQPGEEVHVLIYRNVATSEAGDALLVSREDMQILSGGKSEMGQQPEEDMPGVKTGIEEGSLVLEILNGPNKKKRVQGRIPCVLSQEEADVIVTDPMVSKHHAVIKAINGIPMLVDLNSTAGTTLNGTHVMQHPLSEGDIIGLGTTALKVVRLTLS